MLPLKKDRSVDVCILANDYMSLSLLELFEFRMEYDMDYLAVGSDNSKTDSGILQ